MGIFDKFTGDGALVHFLSDEIAAIGEDQGFEKLDFASYGWRADPAALAKDAVAIRRAVKCGWEMIHAIEYHSERLRKLFRLDIPSFGPAVGIAIGKALWSVDREANPIVVGNGVVLACRITDKTSRGRLRITRDAQSLLASTFSYFPPLAGLPFVSKEQVEDDVLEICEQTDAPAGLCRSKKSIETSVEEIRKKIDNQVTNMRESYSTSSSAL